MKNNLLCATFVVASVILLAACKPEPVPIPQAESFLIEARISGEHEYDAVITETYAEFSGSGLSDPVRWENGMVVCGNISVEAAVNENSLFTLPEFFSALFANGYENADFTEKDGIITVTASVGNLPFSAKLSSETNLPTELCFGEYTISIINITTREPENESYTQNMGDG